MNTQLPESWKKEIINNELNIDWVKETCIQLIKDFEMLGFPLELNPTLDQPYRDLLDQVVDHLQHLSAANHQGLMNLMYRIDLPEADLRLIKQSTSSDFLLSFAEIILKREFMKVIYRHRYSH